MYNITKQTQADKDLTTQKLSMALYKVVDRKTGFTLFNVSRDKAFKLDPPRQEALF